MTDVKLGDLVMLASGGPRMTVVGVNRTEQGAVGAQCGWFNKDGDYRVAHFPLVVLREAPPRLAPHPYRNE